MGWETAGFLRVQVQYFCTNKSNRPAREPATPGLHFQCTTDLATGGHEFMADLTLHLLVQGKYN